MKARRPAGRRFDNNDPSSRLFRGVAKEYSGVRPLSLHLSEVNTMTRSRLTMVALVAAAALGLAACGGGVFERRCAAGAAQSVQVISSGAITGFGSVFVNGVRFETSSAAFMINGKPGTQADLRVGHVVRIHGHRDGAGNSTADRVDFDDLVKVRSRASMLRVVRSS